MNKILTISFYAFILIFFGLNINAQLIVTEVGNLPERVSNNAVCEGFINDKPYLYSFGGIDPSKKYSGIHKRCFRYDIETGESIQLPDMPNTRGKIAAAASRIDHIIYISGGYEVFSDNYEATFNTMHRFDIESNTFLEDAPPIPVPTDDHVQAVWRDSLIYLITGWSNTSNIPNVQIFDPSENQWLVGTPTPNSSLYKSFGASGIIRGDTIYYFGGATSSQGFGIQNRLRKGAINPNNITEITWSISIPIISIKGFRMACTNVENDIHWVGGSTTTYNYDGISYNNTGGVEPADQDIKLQINPQEFHKEENLDLPMDLRGIASLNDTVKYLAGGMIENQFVTDKVFKLEWKNVSTSLKEEAHMEDKFLVYPNPFINYVSYKRETINHGSTDLRIYNLLGELVFEKKSLIQKEQINLHFLMAGNYVFEFLDGQKIIQKVLVEKIR